MFLWAELPEGYDAFALFRLAIARGVSFVPGGAFSPHGECANCLRLNYSNCDPETIRRGVRLLAEAVAEYEKSR
jgi:2-aminoadipate transaminase